VWATASDPTDEWPLCEECQEKEFGGIPPTSIQSDVHNEDEQVPDSKEAADDKEQPDDVAREEKTEETAQATPTADEACNDEERTPKNVIESNDIHHDDTNRDGGEADGDQGEEMEEVWDVRKVMSIADVNDCPIKCSTETCTLAAACVYVSNLAPTEKWYTCLDCQVSICDDIMIRMSSVNRLFTHINLF
jgi:hypothetical protein